LRGDPDRHLPGDDRARPRQRTRRNIPAARRASRRGEPRPLRRGPRAVQPAHAAPCPDPPGPGPATGGHQNGSSTPCRRQATRIRYPTSQRGNPAPWPSSHGRTGPPCVEPAGRQGAGRFRTAVSRRSDRLWPAGSGGLRQLRHRLVGLRRG
jgi:hypothetical protein